MNIIGMKASNITTGDCSPTYTTTKPRAAARL
jgi:hypothetical protein